MTTIWRSLEGFESVLTPRTLSQFLGVQSWAMRSRHSFMETWTYPTGSGRPAYIHVPTDDRDVDFGKRFYEAATEVADIYGWSIAELVEQVAAIRADLFFVRVDQAGNDGTIPLYRASEIIESIEKMVKAAAIVTANPMATGKGRTSERVRSFLEDDLRMGHTKRGSFIITVAARLQDPSVLTIARPAPDLASDTVPDEVATVHRVVEADEAQTEPAPAAPNLDFSRRVMTTLSKGLDATRRHLSGVDSGFIDFDDARDRGMTGPLVEAIEEMGENASGGSFDMSFRWTPAIPQDESDVESVTFTRPLVDRAPALIERFHRNEEPDEVAVVGPVVSLSRERLHDGEESGEVIVLADVDGTTKRIGMTLHGTDYEWAIYAHRNRYPFTATGLLGKKGRRWWLVDRVEPDTSFLKQRRRDYIERQGGDAPDEVLPEVN